MFRGASPRLLRVLLAAPGVADRRAAGRGCRAVLPGYEAGAAHRPFAAEPEAAGIVPAGREAGSGLNLAQRTLGADRAITRALGGGAFVARLAGRAGLERRDAFPRHRADRARRTADRRQSTGAVARISPGIACVAGRVRVARGRIARVVCRCAVERRIGRHRIGIPREDRPARRGDEHAHEEHHALGAASTAADTLGSDRRHSTECYATLLPLARE
jgi:hypothetical protein